jgi:enoyl-CoA hydratase
MVEYEIQGHVAVITLNRPEARNAIDAAMATGLEAALDRVEEDPEVWVAVLGGAGPVFSAGADLKLVAAGRAAGLYTERGGFGGITQRARTKPLIAAVEGPALAGGAEIVLACDLAVASTTASFGLPEVKRSLLAGAGGLLRLPRAVPRGVALHLALTGDTMSAERAFHFGLVQELCEPGSAVAVAIALAERINANAPLAVRAARRVLLGSAGASDEEGFRAASEEMAALSCTEDFAEGPRAFVEKRPPVWTGR